MQNDPNQIKPTDEPLVEDELDDELEEESKETASDSEAPALSPSEPQSAVTTASNATPITEDDADERSEIEKQPYDFEHSTVQIAIQLLSDDGDANGRIVLVGVRSHLDAPILRLVRLNELGALPPIVNELVAALKAELPAREQAAREAFEKKKEERAKRKATVSAAKTSRGKKSKTATLSTAPGSDAAAAIDNRPRPDVKVTAAPQQQMGLL